MTACHNIHAPLHGLFIGRYFLLTANQVMSIAVIPSGSAMFVLDVRCKYISSVSAPTFENLPQVYKIFGLNANLRNNLVRLNLYCRQGERGLISLATITLRM